MRSQRGAKPDTFRITTAPVSRQADIAFRQRRYVISMGVRTLCFLGAVFVGDNWVRWVLVAASFVLPYVAVVMANSASPVVDAAPVEGPGLHRKELGHPGS